MRACLVSSWKTKEDSTSGVERAKGRVMGNEIIEVIVVSSYRVFVGHLDNGCVEQWRNT